MGAKLLDPPYSVSVKWIDGINLRNASTLVQIHDAKVHDGLRIDLKTVNTMSLHRFVPRLIVDDDRTKGRLLAYSVFLLLPPPAMPTVEVVECLPIPLVKEFEFEIQAVVTGMKAPAALELSHVIHCHLRFLSFELICSQNRRQRECALRSNLAFPQTLVLAEMVALSTLHRLRGDGRKLTAEVGFVKRFTLDAEAGKSPQLMQEPLLGRDAHENQMRMLVVGRQEIACDFDARMGGLNGLLGRRDICTNESVDVLGVSSLRLYLRETGLRHFILLLDGGKA